MVEENILLDKKWVGGLYHLYNTTDTWEQWINEFEPLYEWPNDLSEKFIKVIGKNQQHIKNKNVIDLACNLGYFLFGCNNIGAKSALGLEIRQPYIDAFNKVKKHWPYKNISMLNFNIENIDELNKILVDIDTILYTGHLYHTVNHLDILTTFTKSSASCLIVESIVTSKKMSKESSNDPYNGYMDETTDIIDVYAPSIDETTDILESLGWSIENTDIIYEYNPNRFVITATRISGEL